MAVISAVIGSALDLIIELAFPWSEIIMQQVNNLLVNPSISNYPGLSPLISALH